MVLSLVIITTSIASRTIMKVVTLAVYVYFAVSLVGEQWTESEKVKPFALSFYFWHKKSFFAA